MANLLYQTLQPGLDEDLFGADGAAFAAAAVGLNSADESLPYSTSELNAPEYSTDDFRMFQFKVARCSKRYVHDWRACPFAHPTENARRRDPRLIKYLPVPCPDYKRGICLRGDSCTYSHGVYECWLHPAKYRTQLCKEGPNCRRPVCFFAHSVLDLRQPSHMFEGANGAEGMQASVAAALAQQVPATNPHSNISNGRHSVDSRSHGHSHSMSGDGRHSVDSSLSADSRSHSHNRLSTDAAVYRLSPEEMMNNGMNDGGMGGGGNGRGSMDPPSMHKAASAAAALLAASAAAASAHSPGSRQPSLAASLARTSSSNRAGSATHSPDRSGSPTTPGQPASLRDLPAHRSAEVSAASDAAAAMAVLTQQQAAQAQAQAAAALARLSSDSRASLEAASAAAAAAATTQAMLQANAAAGLPTGLPPRMSLDSLLATRQAAAAAQQLGWAPGAVPPPPAATTAAAALAGSAALPLNEQPFPAGNAPRMSNAVARKLGLAPQRASLDARLTKLRGVATPPRSSIDGILHALQQSSARSSLDQQQAMLQQAMSHPQLAMSGLNSMSMNNGGGGNGHMAMNNGYGSYGSHHHSGGPNGGYPMPPNGGNGMHGSHAGGPENMGLHPALLNLVAAQMAPPQHMHPGMAGMPPPGVPHGMHSGLGVQQGGDANMAALMESLHGWQLNGGGGGPSMGHRGGSMDGMGGMANAPGMHGGSPSNNNYYDAKALWGASRQEDINNQAGAE